MAKLTDAQAALFLGKNWGSLATLRRDGSPHVTPVWVDYDGEHVVFNTAAGRAKERHIRRDPRVGICVLPADNQQGGYVSVSGRAEITEEGAFEHIDKLAQKYLGVEKYPNLRPGEQRLIVRITPERVNSLGVD